MVHLTADTLGLAGPLGERATLLQISSGFCAPCRAARGVLARVAETVTAVRHLELDVAHHPELAARLGITQTPTVFLLDADGAVLARHEGVPKLALVRGLLHRLAPRQPAEDSRREAGLGPGYAHTTGTS